MYTSHPRKRQTEILDDATAMAMATGAPEPKKQKSDGKHTGGFSFTKKPKQYASDLKAPKSLRVDSTVSRYYEANGIRIPLFQKGNRKRREARLATALHKRMSEAQLLDIVEEYAGKDKRDQMKLRGKLEVAKWIERVEELALGANRHKTTDIGNDSKRQPGVLDHTSDDHETSYMGTSRQKLVPASQKAKQIINATANAPLHAKDNGHITTANSYLKVPKHIKKAVFLTENVVKKRSFSQIHSIDQDGDIQNLVGEAKLNLSDGPMSPPTEQRRQLKAKERLMLKETNVGPHNPSEGTDIIGPVTSKMKIILGATSRTEVYQPRVCHSPKTNAPRPLRRPYLKPGKHGWDWENHRWYFADDPDLEIGVGHEIEPADKDRLDEEPKFRGEFYKKYPGRFAHTWPCGCQKPWNDDESEEE